MHRSPSPKEARDPAPGCRAPSRRPWTRRCRCRDRLVLTGDLPAERTDSAGPRENVEFGEDVELAVKSFQQRAALLVDGIVGRSTYAVLDGARWSLGDRVLRFLPGHPLEGDDVAQLQARLAELGFSPGKIDGIHAEATDAALRRFQTGVGLDADGTLGPETMRAFAALRRSVTGAPPSRCGA